MSKNESTENIEQPLNAVSKLRFWNRRKLPVIIQSEAAECGLACLAMIASYHGYHTDLIELRRKFNSSLAGTTLRDVMRFAQHFKLTSRPLRIDLKDLPGLETPCLLHWDLNHFVVLKSVTKNNIVIHDPARGQVTLSVEQASKHFTGIALELSPTSEFTPQAAKANLKFSDFWTKITGLKSSLLLIFTLSLLLQIFALASPYYMQLVVDDVILTADKGLLSALALGFGLLVLFEVLTSSLRGLSLLHFSNLLNLQLGSNLFHHLIRLPLSYFEKRHMGDVVSRFGSLQRVRELLTTGAIEAVLDGIMVVITLLMMFFYSPKLAVIVCVVVGLYGTVRFLLFNPLRAINEQEIIARAEEQSNFMETIRAIQTIKLFGSEVEREGQWQNRYTNTINQTIRLGHFQLSFAAINRLLFGLENILIIYLATLLVIEGGFSAGMLFAFIAYKNQFKDKAARLIEKLIEFKMLGLHFDRLADIALSQKEELQKQTKIGHVIRGKLSVSNLSFKYSETSPKIIDKFNLVIKAGESVAITGPSGCGKSTLLKLMLGLLKPESGEILVDDLPMAQIGHYQYRQQIASVMQDDTLLSGSIANNIAFFDSPIDMQHVIHCASLAAINDDINKMPMGYDSLVGDMGSTLSGGQIQRLLLARALYRRPKILFMDEATSHLDSELESDISSAIRTLNISRVIIAHRKSTIASADREVRLASQQNT